MDDSRPSSDLSTPRHKGRLASRFFDSEDVQPVVFARAVPVLVRRRELCAEAGVQPLARPWPGVTVDRSEIVGNVADEEGFEDPSIALILVAAKNRVRVAVDRLWIARAAFRHLEPPIQR